MKTPLEAPPSAAPTDVIQPASVRLDATNAADLRAAFVAAATGHRPLVVDLSGVSYVDAFGLEAMLDGVRAARRAVTFVGVRLEVRDFLRRNDVLGFLHVLPAGADR